ncbi:MAG: hypothetical protein WA766_06090 [Candidatus Acidiferrales bacterium]
MARPGLLDTTAVPWGLFDKCGQDQGWFDRDLLTYPVVAPPWYSTLLYIGGWEPAPSEREMAAGAAWELGLDTYGLAVTFKAFEEKILVAQHDSMKRDEFRQMAATFHAERLEKMKIVKRVITVAGVSYVVWKLVMLL